LTRKAIELAMASDPTALRLCLERLIPPARKRPLDIDRLSDDPAAAIGESIKAVTASDHLPSEGERLAGMVKAKAVLTSLRKIEEQLAALEATSEGDHQALSAANNWLALTLVCIPSNRVAEARAPSGSKLRRDSIRTLHLELCSNLVDEG
jgi:hypothetical protein